MPITGRATHLVVSPTTEGSSAITETATHESRLLALSPDLLGAAGFDGYFKQTNPAWSSLGYSDEQLRATPYIDFVHPSDREGVGATVAELAQGGRVDEFSCRLRRADGEYRWLLWSAHGSPEDECVYIAGKDITDRRQLEQELARRAERLERTNVELQEFAYIASHDLSEPLRMVTSYLELLQRRYAGQLDDTADEFIGFAVGGARRMKALIDDLLTYSRVGSHEAGTADVDLGEVVADVLQILQPAIAESGAEVEVVEPLPCVLGDAVQLGQLVQNLIANAVKFRPPERPPRIVVSALDEVDGTRLTVADDGIGIDPDKHEQIFKMFARLHAREQYDGTGIGLALCRRIAERHGGRIWVESNLGAGSAFQVWFPRP